MEDYFTPYNITSKQVSQLLGIHLRNAQDKLKEIRQDLGKLKNAYVSVEEFCTETGIPMEDAVKALESIAPGRKQ
jgi:predicted RNA-binding protein with EMAP domain